MPEFSTKFPRKAFLRSLFNSKSREEGAAAQLSFCNSPHQYCTLIGVGETPTPKHLAPPIMVEGQGVAKLNIRIWLPHCIRQSFLCYSIANLEIIVVPTNRVWKTSFGYWASPEIALIIMTYSKRNPIKIFSSIQSNQLGCATTTQNFGMCQSVAKALIDISAGSSNIPCIISLIEFRKLTRARAITKHE